VSGMQVVVASGDALTRGRTVGRELRDLIGRSIEFYHGYLERRGVRSLELQELLAPYLGAAERAMPEATAVIKGMAEGAMVPVWELFAVNAFEEMEPLLEPAEGLPLFLRTKEGSSSRTEPLPPRHEYCSTVTVAGPGYTLLGHNEHWLSGDAGNVALVVDVPGSGRPSVASPTVVCCLPAVGVNSGGAAQGIGSVTASDDRVGVPRVLVSRRSLEAVDRAGAVQRATFPERAGGYGHVFAFHGGDTFVVETTATHHAVLPGPGPHTNHYLDPSLAEIAPPPSAGSLGRLQRLKEALERERPTTPEGLMSVMADHQGAPQSVCLHPEEDEGDDASAVLFSMVCEMEAERMWVASGNPCTAPFEEIDLSPLRST
jgi:isopenicillin-N N-acyltransferase like protein